MTSAVILRSTAWTSQSERLIDVMTAASGSRRAGRYNDKLLRS
jgi:hypothetical protein